MYEKGLETFLAVAMSRTLKEAANMLNLAQSTVSYNLKNLEKLLDAELIDRKKGYKTVQLTAAGNTLLPLAMKWSEVIREIESIKSEQRHQLSIGCVESVNHCLFPDFYRSLAEQITLKITTNHSLDLYQMIEDRTLDVAFVVNQIISSNLGITLFSREKMKVLRTKNAAPDPPRTVDASELNPRFEVFLNWSFAYQIWHDHVWPNAANGAHFETDTVRHIDSFLAGDARYWIIVPASVADYYTDKGFVAMDLHPEPPERICYMLVHKKPNPSTAAAIRVFNEALDAWFGGRNKDEMMFARIGNDDPS